MDKATIEEPTLGTLYDQEPLDHFTDDKNN